MATHDVRQNRSLLNDAALNESAPLYFVDFCCNAAASAPQQSESEGRTRRHSTVTPVLNAAGEVISTEAQGEQIVFLVIQFSCIVSFLSLQSSNCSSLYLSNCASGTQSSVVSF